MPYFISLGSQRLISGTIVISASIASRPSSSGSTDMNIRSMLMRAICAATNRFTPSGDVMTNRPAVLVRVVDDDGLSGWGEVWCNFPSADANQAWEVDEARAMLPALEAFELRWLEEPLRADRPWAHWLRLRELSPIPLAAGENIAGEAGFAAPVVSISLGDPARFRMGGLARRDPTASTVLRSGDVVVMGGAARLAYHGVDRVMFGEGDLLPGGGRINLTLRVVRSA